MVIEFLLRYVPFPTRRFESAEHFGKRPFGDKQVIGEETIRGLLESFLHIRRDGIVRRVDLLVELSVSAQRRSTKDRSHCRTELHSTLIDGQFFEFLGHAGMAEHNPFRTLGIPIRDSGLRSAIRDSRFGIRDSGFGQDQGLGIRD